MPRKHRRESAKEEGIAFSFLFIYPLHLSDKDPERGRRRSLEASAAGSFNTLETALNGGESLYCFANTEREKHVC